MIKKYSGFTIVELLVVIVIIAILAVITLVSFGGISREAIEASLKADLKNSSTLLELDNVRNGIYPATIGEANQGKGLKPSPDTTFDYTYNPTDNTYELTATSDTNNTITYLITSEVRVPTLFSGVIFDPADWLTIGTQTWAKANLNVGTMVTGATEQTDNAAIEKYCYSNLESNCTTDGGLYQWNEAMQYTTSEGAQGICPAGSHIPSDNEWKILEVALGMTQLQADDIMWRGTDEGTKLRPGGTSGLDIPLGGMRFDNGTFSNRLSYAFVWASSASAGNAWFRELGSATNYENVWRSQVANIYGHSVRCLKD